MTAPDTCPDCARKDATYDAAFREFARVVAELELAGATVDALEEAVHTVERPTKVRVICTVCRPKAEKLFAALHRDPEVPG